MATVANGNDVMSANGRSTYALFCLFAVYLGLLAGDQSIPSLGSADGLAELRFLILALCLALLPGLLTPQYFRSWTRADMYFIALTALFSYMVVTSFWSPPGVAPIGFYVDASVLLLFVLVGMVAASRMNVAAWDFFWIATVGIGAVFAAAGFVTGSPGEGRMAAFGGGPNVFVRIVGTSALVSAYLAFRRARARWLIPTVVLTAAAVFSGSRGGMIALAGSLLLTSVVGRRWVRAEGKRFVLAISFAVGALLMAVFFGDRIVGVVSERFGEQLITEGQTSGRTRLYAAGIDIWSDSYVFGNGIGTFAVEYGNGFTYAHNIVLDVLIDGGLLGLFLFLFVLAVAARPALHYRSHFDVIVPATIATFYLLASQFSGTYYDTRFVWIFLGVVCSVYSTKTARHNVGG